MSEPNKKEDPPEGLADKLSGLGQKIIGEVEMIGGILTADPNTAAEGEFNLEVGELRSEVEEDLETSKPPDAESPRTEGTIEEKE
ncbi:MAG TPA: hypothetical protein PKD24_02485 [Pyrinomonadaceae bacterium]|nr:hypothetical protein [Pyrinomonadaceae bacterium]HMP63973.1 hypothetical protein [Pyrinomonadaceae bacterium]